MGRHGHKKEFYVHFPGKHGKLQMQAKGGMWKKQLLRLRSIKGGLFDPNQLFKVFQAFSDVHLC